jgi:Tol biopolymer transport system component
MRSLLPLLSGMILLPLASYAQSGAPARSLALRDLTSMRDVADPQLAPDGTWVAYTVSRVDSAADKRDADVWMARTDGSQNLRVTTKQAAF